MDPSLEELKKARASATGYFHTDGSHAIQTYANFLFAFSLMKTKTQEGVLLGKELFEKLYLFQTESGHFPKQLHEYPAIFEPHASEAIAFLLNRMKSEFASILAAEFIQKTDEVLSRLPSHTTSKKVVHPTTAELAEAASPEDRLLWHENLSRYAGPAYQEFFVQGVPEVTFFDIACGSSKKGASLYTRMKANLLEEEKPIVRTLPREVHHEEYSAFFQEDRALSWIKKREDHPRFHQKGFSFIRLLQKGEGTLHSMTLEPGRIDRVELVSTNPFSFEIILAPQFDESKRDHAHEFSLLFDLGTQLPKKTLFRIGEAIPVVQGSKSFEIKIEVHHGKGDFCLHQLLSKRASEKEANVYCRELSLRTLRREEGCSLRITLQY